MLFLVYQRVTKGAWILWRISGFLASPSLIASSRACSTAASSEQPWRTMASTNHRSNGVGFRNCEETNLGQQAGKQTGKTRKMYGWKIRCFQYPRNRQHCKTTKEGLPMIGLSLLPQIHCKHSKRGSQARRDTIRWPATWWPWTHWTMFCKLWLCTGLFHQCFQSRELLVRKKTSLIGWRGRCLNWKRFCTS